MNTPPTALTIAGSDSSGGAGIQADLKTFHALGVYGMSAVTALTAQNTTGVTGVYPVSGAFVSEQIRTTVEDIPPDAVKTGMLANQEIIEAVAETADRLALPNLVVDPVIVATTGALLIESGAVGSLLDLLIPMATVVTPNAPEAAALVGSEVRTVQEQIDAARRLVEERGAAAVLVKGGDLPGDEVTDVFFSGDEPLILSQPRIETTNTHGSGCVLASAIAAFLAHGEELAAAIEGGRGFVRRAIERAPRLGHGRGPLDLFPKTD